MKNNKYGYPRPVVGGYMNSKIKMQSNIFIRGTTYKKGTGTNLGLIIVLDAGISEYYCSSTNSYGFKILLHSPNETPRITHYGTQGR